MQQVYYYNINNLYAKDVVYHLFLSIDYAKL